jgi:hypothetical protein
MFPTLNGAFHGALFVNSSYKELRRMEEKDQTIGFRVTSTERQKLEEEASAAGQKLTDYVRSKVFSTGDDGTGSAGTGELANLIKHAIYQINQTHTALYSIAEAQGKAHHFLSTEELREVYNRVEIETLKYAVTFPESFAAVQAKIAAMAKERS